MAERQGAVPHPDQPRPLGPVERLRRDAERLGRGEHDRQPAGVLGRRDEQRAAGRLGQPTRPLGEDPLNGLGQRERRRQRLGPASCPAVSTDGSSTSASGLPPVHSTRRSRTSAETGAAPRTASSSPAVSRIQTPQRQLRQPGSRKGPRLPVADREHHRHPLGSEPPGDEHQRDGRCVVEPVRVIHQTQQRSLLRHLRHQRQHRERDQEPVVRRARSPDGSKPIARRSAAAR